MTSAVFTYSQDFVLENGSTLPGFQLAYQTLGTPTTDPSRIIWVCHALTANAHPEEWWTGLVGKGKLLDPEKFYLICANMLGSCYGSTHALSLNPHTKEPYFHAFPLLSNRDIARAFDLLRESLEIEKIGCLIGGSLGGQQLLEWAIQAPNRFEKIVPIATNARHSPWGIAFNESQRMAIQADASWGSNHPEAGLKGMEAARSIALLSYRNYATYLETQLEPDADKLEHFRATTYQQYQGQKLRKRFDAFAYWTLSKAMDSQHVGRGRGGLETALTQIQAKTLVIGVDTDLLFPVEEQRFLAEHIPGAAYAEIRSRYGHDGFLIETDQLEEILRPFLGE